MKRILLVGLTSYDNLGDSILVDTCKYLVQKSLDKNGVSKFTNVDIADMMITSDQLISQRQIGRLNRFLSMGLTYAAEKLEKVNLKVSYYLYSLKNKVKYKKYFTNKVKDSDAIVFVGGAYLKFKGEEFQYSIRHIITLAEKYNVPVMMNAVGVEGYDEEDIRCKHLKKVINKDCVKILTTRDSVSILNDSFIERREIITDEVGDPALWLNECYNINSTPKYDVGINVAYKSLFEYNNVFSRESYFDITEKLILKLQEKKISFALFCNGKADDYNGGLDLIDKLNLDKELMVDKPDNPLEYVNQVSMFKSVVPIRLHAYITAFALNIPITGFVWNPKVRHFLNTTNQQQYFQSLDNLSAEDITNNIEKFLLNGSDFKKIPDLKLKTYEYIDLFIRTYVV